MTGVLSVLLEVAGVGLIALALSHLAFARALRWRDELERVSLLTRQIFHVHTFFICVVLVGMGALSLFGTKLLLDGSPLAKAVLAAFAVFWALRVFCQWFVYDASLWRGNRLNTAIHWLFTVVFSALTAVYAWALFA